MTGRTLAKLAVLGAASLVLAGCASTMYEGKYSFREGWRAGKVVKVVNGSQLEHPGFWNCTRKLSQAELAAHDYAVVSYRRVSAAPMTFAAPLTSGQKLQPDDRVYVNLSDCDQPAVRSETARG